MVRLRLVAVMACCMMTLGACSGNSGADSKQLADLKAQLSALQKQERSAKTELAAVEDGVATTTTTSAPSSGVSADASAVGLAFYDEEFKVTVASTAVTPDPDRSASAILEIKLDCENLGGSEGYCPGDARIESGGEFYSPSSNDTPLVPPGRTGKGAYRFRVDDKFSLVTAVLRVGTAPRHVVVIPLCPGSASPDTVTLAPVDLPVTGAMDAGEVSTTLKRLRLAVDYPTHRSREAKKLTMYLTMDVAAKVAEEYKGYYLDFRNYTLKLPNGNTSEAEAWSIESDYVNNERSEPDVVIRFEVTNPPAGAYTLQYKPPLRGSDPIEPGAVGVTI